MTAHQLARLTLGEAIDAHAVGTIGATEYEAYRRAWALAGGLVLGYRNATGYATPGPDDVEQLAAEIVAAAKNGRDRLPFEAAA